MSLKYFAITFLILHATARCSQHWIPFVLLRRPVIIARVVMLLLLHHIAGGACLVGSARLIIATRLLLHGLIHCRRVVVTLSRLWNGHRLAVRIRRLWSGRRRRWHRRTLLAHLHGSIGRIVSSVLIVLSAATGCISSCVCLIIGAL